MTQHVYARVAGFKLAVIPRAPFRISVAPQPPNAIDVEYRAPSGALFARVIPDDGGYKSKTDQYTPSLYDVVDIEPGPDIDHWQIESSIFRCDWPSAYTIASNNFPSDPAPFDLLGPNREMIYIQHPKNVPAVTEMCAPNQTVIHIERSSESEWIELAYDHEGTPWRQRHEVIAFPDRRIVITMQAPHKFAEQAALVAQEVALSLKPYEAA
jgi:hypothetical protein